ncbi:MAG: GNAT family N-acetyltransferase [Anaerolineae bacterium]|nr:GNAT family N-acetyltransferase [Anaerolineae bacterium]
MQIDYRPIITSSEIEQTVDLHGQVWGASDRDAIPAHVLHAINHAGGLLLGAFDGSQLVGFALAFPAVLEGELLLWSHATGVLPAYQGRGIGRQLKWLQRDWALEQGYNCIGWTYDPLQAKNANFNIAVLGCICNRYLDDFYGEVDDDLNRGLPTDRFEVRWWLSTERVWRCAAGAALALDMDGVTPVLVQTASGEPGQITWPAGETTVAVEIPERISQAHGQSLSHALAWRMATRQVFHRLFAMGYVVEGFVRSQSCPVHCYYILRMAT